MNTNRTLFFLTIFGLLTLSIAAMTIHSVVVTSDKKMIQNISALTKLPPPAFSAQYLEPRIRVYRDYRDHLYPKMHPIDYLGFVYAK